MNERKCTKKRSQTGTPAQQEVANIFSTSQALVSMRMNMLKLPQNILDMLDHNPELFNASCGQTIAALLKAYPEEGALIESAVMRLQDGASQNSIKPWVEQMLKAKNKAIAKMIRQSLPTAAAVQYSRQRRPAKRLRSG
jgi:hypothetical protein